MEFPSHSFRLSTPLALSVYTNPAHESCLCNRVQTPSSFPLPKPPPSFPSGCFMPDLSYSTPLPRLTTLTTFLKYHSAYFADPKLHSLFLFRIMKTIIHAKKIFINHTVNISSSLVAGNKMLSKAGPILSPASLILSHVTPNVFSPIQPNNSSVPTHDLHLSILLFLLTQNHSLSPLCLS